MLADVCVRARALRGCPQAVAAGHARIDRRCVLPSAVGDRKLGSAGGHRPDVAFRQVQAAFVFGAHGAVEEVGVTQTHSARDVSEKCLQGYPGANECGGVGVPCIPSGRVRSGSCCV